VADLERLCHPPADRMLPKRLAPQRSALDARPNLPHAMSANPMDGWSHINGTWMMTAQERKDFRRVQKSRDIWKKRAVGRGEDSRRLRERRKEVDRSREAWHDRALDAEHRIDQLEIENHQLKSALTQASQTTTIDNTH